MSMREVSADRKFIIADHNSCPAELISPNPRGWYHSVANVVATPSGLVAVYRLSDSHSAVCTHIMVAYSRDGGRTWRDHRSLSQRNVWGAPERLDRSAIEPPAGRTARHHLRYGPSHVRRRLAAPGLLAAAPKRDGQLPVLERRPRPYLEPTGPMRRRRRRAGLCRRPVRGTLVYTPHRACRNRCLRDPASSRLQPLPPQHRRLSDDRGTTWNRTVTLSDDPYHSDSEVGLVELEPGHLLAVTRVGFANGLFASPAA